MNQYEKWKELKEELEELFRQRNRQEALKKMEVAVENYHLLKTEMMERFELSTLPLLNEDERLGFITDNLSHYHSFIQLKELYVEFEKYDSKMKAMKKERC